MARRTDLLHERVDGEWSFIQTLRHLVIATDISVRRAILGDPTVRRVIEGLTEERLAAQTEPVVGPGTLLNEEWQHPLYAERDLDILQGRDG